jgi:hypothetical protein
MFGYLEFIWPMKSLRAVDHCGLIVNMLSTYLCQHFGFIRLDLMTSS